MLFGRFRLGDFNLNNQQHSVLTSDIDEIALLAMGDNKQKITMKETVKSLWKIDISAAFEET